MTSPHVLKTTFPLLLSTTCEKIATRRSRHCVTMQWVAPLYPHDGKLCPEASIDDCRRRKPWEFAGRVFSIASQNVEQTLSMRSLRGQIPIMIGSRRSLIIAWRNVERIRRGGHCFERRIPFIVESSEIRRNYKKHCLSASRVSWIHWRSNKLFWQCEIR